MKVFKSTTLGLHNRLRDRERIEAKGIPEKGSPTTILMDPSGTYVIAYGYVRVVYGDHGPYIELTWQHIDMDRWRCTRKGTGYYDIYRSKTPVDGIELLLYHQRMTVAKLPSPPKGPWSCDNFREEGYADYRVGRFYVAADKLKISRKLI